MGYIFRLLVYLDHECQLSWWSILALLRGSSLPCFVGSSLRWLKHPCLGLMDHRCLGLIPPPLPRVAGGEKVLVLRGTSLPSWIMGFDLPGASSSSFLFLAESTFALAGR